MILRIIVRIAIDGPGILIRAPASRKAVTFSYMHAGDYYITDVESLRDFIKTALQETIRSPETTLKASLFKDC